MKAKRTRKLISYIAVIAMLLSIFNIPVLGYANTNLNSQETIDYSNFRIQTWNGDGYEDVVDNSVIVKNFDQSYSHDFRILFNDGDTFPLGNITITSQNDAVVWTYLPNTGVVGDSCQEIPFVLTYEATGETTIGINFTPEGEDTPIHIYDLSVSVSGAPSETPSETPALPIDVFMHNDDNEAGGYIDIPAEGIIHDKQTWKEFEISTTNDGNFPIGKFIVECSDANVAQIVTFDDALMNPTYCGNYAEIITDGSSTAKYFSLEFFSPEITTIM